MCAVVSGLALAWLAFWRLINVAAGLFQRFSERNRVKPNPPTEEEAARWREELIKLGKGPGPTCDASDDFAWEDVERCRKNKWLQRDHPMDEGQGRFLRYAKACPQCSAEPKALAWFYFSNAKGLGGCAGWMTVCDGCHKQVGFFMEAIS